MSTTYLDTNDIIQQVGGMLGKTKNGTQQRV